ncbi:hypothetical protein SAMN05421747_10118 [Parapedobacter composti]|uniref:2Fe-2S iron-sulfur cluster binding domain-containing protein n=1 Tax=Parapedobacter composti TaxID=623281 RepID=A0A1I1DR37_9SPHI|nr:hypothetical protein [Parapedobacter composti]SFB77445.1 hypothetical protein SAMN05421747_10118 [Parapedobacter composti]
MNLRINGKDYDIDVPADTTLLDTLRIHLKLTGSKYGCGEGRRRLRYCLLSPAAEQYEYSAIRLINCSAMDMFLFTV